ncbi:hypothetical protein GQ457_04G023900 [Hibiscus cannabinus]
MLEVGEAPQPMNEEELFQTIRRGPSPQTQSSLFPSFHEEVSPTYAHLSGNKKLKERENDIEKDRTLMVQNTNPLSSVLRNYGVTRIPKIVVVNHEQEEEETISSSSSDYESSECSHTTAEDMIMATNQPEVKTEDSEVDPMDTATPSTTTTPPTIGVKYNLTIDDIPMAKWAQRFQEFHSWMETQKLNRESHCEILTEFVSRFTGILRDWWGTISPGDQMQFLVQQDFTTIVRILHNHFLGNQEDAMVKLFFALGADQSFKQVILASIPELLQNAVDRNLQQRRKHILQLTVGEIQQETFIALEELCDRKKNNQRIHDGKQRPREGVQDTRPNNQVQERRVQLQKKEQTGIAIPDDEDIESLFSIEDEPSDQSLFAIQALDEEQEITETE